MGNEVLRREEVSYVTKRRSNDRTSYFFFFCVFFPTLYCRINLDCYSLHNIADFSDVLILFFVLSAPRKNCNPVPGQVGTFASCLRQIPTKH